MRAGLRTQLFVVSSVLLAIPFLGLRSAREIEAFLVETQEQGLGATARAVATALGERPAIFLSSAGTAPPVPGAADSTVRIEALTSAIRVDGSVEDWAQQQTDIKTIVMTVATVATAPAPPTPPDQPAPESSPNPAQTPAANPLRATWHIGRFERSVFVLIEVVDDTVVRQSSDFARFDTSDGVEIAMVTADDEFLRFAIHAAGDGSSRVALIGGDGSEIPDSRIEAAFVETDTGYRVEARVPRTMVGTRIGLAVNDVDDPETRVLVSRVATGGTADRVALANAFAPTPELSAIVQSLGRTRSRIWILDATGRVLAHSGTLQAGRTPLPPPTWRQNLVSFLRPIYRSILIEPTEDFTDVGPDAERLEGPEISRALGGAGAHWRRRTSDGRAAVLSAAEPVWTEGKIVGAVLAEETTNETLAARNRAFERLFFSIALAVLVGALTLLAFASSLSSRIRRLRDAVERAIDSTGRVQGDIPHATAPDEVGDLSRSFASMLERQRQYTAYLEELRSRLSHEIRTPVAVVRSSLDNLRLQSVPASAAVYLDRADEGLSRLVTILQRMTEASRLEQTLATTSREPFDLRVVVSGCVAGYRVAQPSRRIDLIEDDDPKPMIVEGAPDLVAQLMDKLIENALDFAAEGTVIEVRLNRGLGTALLTVSNEGPWLPEGPSESIFGSMVSSRRGEASGGVHLGLGLTIVKAIADFHRATATASNRRDPAGVSFLIAFPLMV